MPPKGYPADYKNPPPINPPAFTKRRLCEGNPEWLTAPQSGPRAEEFKTVCRHCPALKQCEAYLQAHEKAGAEISGIVAGRTWRKLCPKGHLMTPENTYTYPGTTRTKCRQCLRDQQRHKRQQLRRKDHAHAA